MLFAALVAVLGRLSWAHLAADVAASHVLGGDASCAAEVESEVEGCLKPMLSYATSLSSSNGLLPLEGMQVFDKLCLLYGEFQRCTGSLGCASLSVQAMDASYGFMCGDGQDQFKSHVECFAEVEGVESYLTCKNEATGAVNSLHFDAAQPTAYFAKLCTTMQQYLHCSRPIILASCGAEAWGLVTRVTRDSLKVTMPKCHLTPFLEIPPKEAL